MTKKQREEIKLGVLKQLNWEGVRMFFPYRFKFEENKNAYIKTEDLLKIIRLER